MRETQETIGSWAISTFGQGELAWVYARRIRDEVDELLNAAAVHDRDRSPESLAALEDELADVLVTLRVMAHRFASDVDSGVDRKMAVNRYEREWIPNGDGTGRHKKPFPDGATHP